MIRKFGSVAVDPDQAREIALAAEHWPQWMPNIKSTKVIEQSAQRTLVEVRRSQGRRMHKTRLELLPTSSGYTERQISGLARRWELDWEFRKAPGGEGAIVSCRFDVDLGFFGIFIPRRTVQRLVDRTFEKILRGLEAQARGTVEGGEESRLRPVLSLADVESIRIFATESELEIWLGDRKYVAERAGD